MCLKTNGLKFERANKNITCYKVLSEYFPGCYCTPFTCDMICNGIEVPTDWLQKATHEMDIYHDTFMDGSDYVISGGVIHSFVNKDDASAYCHNLIKQKDYSYKSHVFKCVIPAGADYIKGDTGTTSAICASYGSDKLEYQEVVETIGEFDESEDNFTRFLKVLTNSNESWKRRKDNLTVYKRLFSFLCKDDSFIPSYELHRFMDCKKKRLKFYIPPFDFYSNNIMSWFLEYNGNNFYWSDLKKTIIIYAVNVAALEVEGIENKQKVTDRILDDNALETVKWDDMISNGDVISTMHIDKHFESPIDYLMFMLNNDPETINMVQYYVVRQMIKAIGKKIKE